MTKIKTIAVLIKHMKLLKSNALFNSNEGKEVINALEEAIKMLE